MTRTAPAPRSSPALAVTAIARSARILERASGELGLAHFRVLSAIDGGDARATRIAQRLTLGKPAVSAAIETLVRRGLVRRDAADDQRAVTLSLTRQGCRLLRHAEGEMTRRLDALLARTPDSGAVLRALVELGEAVEREQMEAAGQPAGSPVAER